MSGDEPAKGRRRFFILLGSAALTLSALAAALAFKPERVLAQDTAKPSVSMAGVSNAKAQNNCIVKITKQAPDKLKLKGIVATEDDHKALLGLVKASFPSADVKDRLKIANIADTQMKLGGFSFALKALSYLQAGSAKIDNEGIELTGSAETSAVYAEVKTFIETGVPSGVILKDVKIKSPTTSFVWRADFEDGRVIISGVVPNQSGRQELQNAVGKLFSGLEVADHTHVASGAPESWLEAAMHSLKVLRLLDSGFVQVSDQGIWLDGQAADDATLRHIDSLADKYPAGFSLQTKLSAPEKPSGDGSLADDAQGAAADATTLQPGETVEAPALAGGAATN